MKELIKGNLTPENISIAKGRNFKVKICLRCKAHNAIGAKQCRKCGYKRLRLKNSVLDIKNKN